MLAGLVMAQQQLRLPAPRSLSNRGSEANPRALTLVKLIESVNRNYPPLRAASLERPLAEVDMLNQQGRFDLSLKARSENQRLGFYENERFEIVVEQPTTLWGATVYSGYSVSEGRYPDYLGALITNGGGQYKAGVRVPLGAIAKSTAGAPNCPRLAPVCVRPTSRSTSSAWRFYRPPPAAIGIGWRRDAG